MQVTIQGFDELRRRLSDPQIRGFAKDAMEQAVALLSSETARYPPPPPWSTYRRTGTLGRNWRLRVETSGNNVTGKVYNETPYGPFVQGKEQVWFHKRTGWRTLPDVATKQMKAIEAFFTDALKRMRDYMAGG